MIKNLTSSYLTGKEKSVRTENWLKMKPDYGNVGMCGDMDMLILGRYLGKGKNGRGWGFLCGVQKARGDKSKFHTVTKVGSGLNYTTLEELLQFLRPFERVVDQCDSTTLPSHFDLTSILEPPHFWYPPEKSAVLQLKCNELVPATGMTAGYTCRFPRVQRWRKDKTFGETMTIEELKEIVIAPRHIVTTSDRAVTVRETGLTKRRKLEERGSKVSRSRQFQQTKGSVLGLVRPLPESEVEGSLFNGMKFVVFESDFRKWTLGPAPPSIESVKTAILKQGGDLIATINPRNIIEGTLCIVGDPSRKGYTVKVQNEMDEGRFDFLHFRYLLACIELGEVLDLSEHNEYYIKPSDGICYLSVSIFFLDT